ncbi:hypothetical protein MC7420_5437 [Coleofasciculus chthonoplastes PCC 7420]|uniref:Uncharacterized protein n=1 Tax=Coleofasciculus chthonoplastes PCC 7420 TaxID=118168 RepID=B4VPM8_9CYAN|nr:hypothetical protein MC7420_5437 [Coleofasciculus chthonoplastes PCC 7420]
MRLTHHLGQVALSKVLVVGIIRSMLTLDFVVESRRMGVKPT